MTIKEFVDFKYKTPDLYRQRQLDDQDRFQDYPLDWINDEGEVERYYIQDIISEELEDGTKHKTSVLLMAPDYKVLQITTICTSPCFAINWDKVACIWSIQL